VVTGDGCWIGNSHCCFGVGMVRESGMRGLGSSVAALDASAAALDASVAGTLMPEGI